MKTTTRSLLFIALAAATGSAAAQDAHAGHHDHGTTAKPDPHAGHASAAPAAPATQQDKMKSCNADAATKALKGDERKAFMSECLKK